MIIMLLAAALDYFLILGEDLHIEFFIAPNRKKYYLILGPEVCPLEGKYFIVTWYLYGLKSAETSFRDYTELKLYAIGFKSTHVELLEYQF